MREYLNKLPKEIQGLIGLVSQLAVHKGMPVYLVGGFVRDLILGVKNLDLDIVVEGDGISFAEDLAVILKAKLLRHKRFKTATVIPGAQLKIDIASARKEFYPEPAHLPVVENSTLKDDHFRRDFTINAMAISIAAENFGRLIDFFGGEEDLRRKKIRILHDLSFIDDPTRILRAVRFEKRYDFRIEPKTLGLIKRAVRLKMLDKVQPQRIRDELMLMLEEERPVKQIRRLQGLAGLGFIYPRLRVSEKVCGLLRSIEEEINWFKKIHHYRRPIDVWLIYFMGIIDHLTLSEKRQVCRKFVLHSGEEKRIFEFDRNEDRVISKLSLLRIRPSEIFAVLSPLSYETILLLKAKHKNPRLDRHIKDFLAIYNDLRISVTGHDLKRMGIPPGPDYQKIFENVHSAKLDGLVKAKEEELDLVRRITRIP